MKQQKSYGRIRETELDRVAELHSRGYGVTAIARELGRAKSSISELIALNKDGRDGVFRAALAVRRRVERKLRQRKRVKLVVNERLLLEIYIGMVSISDVRPSKLRTD
jgi:IS30 family transposase